MKRTGPILDILACKDVPFVPVEFVSLRGWAGREERGAYNVCSIGRLGSATLALFFIEPVANFLS